MSLSTIRRLNASDRETTERDGGRLVQTLDEMFAALGSLFRARLKRSRSIITPQTTRPTLRMDEFAVVDSVRDSVDLYLPSAKPSDAGRVVAFVKKYTNNHVNLRTTDGATINGVYTLIYGLSQMGLHELLWDGSGWWFREPRSRVRLHDTSFRPVGLWQFSDDTTPLVDTSGNGFDLTVETGTQFTGFTDTHRGAFYFDGSTALIYNVAEPALALTGDMSFFCLWVNHTGVNSSSIVHHGAAGETEVTNVLYRLGYATYPATVYQHEQGLGVDVNVTVNALLSMPGQIVHVGFTRRSNVVQIWHNARPHGSPSGVLTAPTGGTDGRFRLGGSNAVRANGAITSAMICNYALSDAEVRRAYNMTMGLVYGFTVEVDA